MTGRRLSKLPTGAVLIATALIAAVIVAGVALALSSSDSGSSDSADAEKGGDSARVQPAPQLDDPPAEARALAGWLRAQGR